MKEKATRKFLKENYHIINIGNQPMQTLFTFEDASYYCTRVEGWACDGYVFGDYVIVTGYDCPGKLIPYEITQKYEKKAVCSRNFRDFSSIGKALSQRSA